MRNLEKWRQSSISDLKVMIFVSKIMRFFTTNLGNFLLSFTIIIGLPVLLCGPHLAVFTFAIITHFLYMVLNRNSRYNTERQQDYWEWTDEIKTYQKFLKEKQEKQKKKS